MEEANTHSFSMDFYLYGPSDHMTADESSPEAGIVESSPKAHIEENAGNSPASSAGSSPRPTKRRKTLSTVESQPAQGVGIPAGEAPSSPDTASFSPNSGSFEAGTGVVLLDAPLPPPPSSPILDPLPPSQPPVGMDGVPEDVSAAPDAIPNAEMEVITGSSQDNASVTNEENTPQVLEPQPEYLDVYFPFGLFGFGRKLHHHRFYEVLDIPRIWYRYPSRTRLPPPGKDKSTSTPPSLPSLLTLPDPVRSRILRDVLTDHFYEQEETLWLQELDWLPPIFRVCKQLRREAVRICSSFPLHVDHPVDGCTNRYTRNDDAVEEHILWEKRNIQMIYGKLDPSKQGPNILVPNMTVDVPVIHQPDGPNWDDLEELLIRSPNLNPNSQLMFYYGSGDERTQWNNVIVWSQRLICESLERYQAPCVDIVTGFAPIDHSNMFSWIQYAGFEVDCLNVDVKGLELWEGLPATRGGGLYRSIPLLALIASIIGNQPQGLRKITISGLGPICRNECRDMWNAIPHNAPFAPQNGLLAALVIYPFGASHQLGHRLPIDEVYRDGSGNLRPRPRAETLFGLKSSTEWEAKIMRARHRRQTEWNFLP